jgi:hypothetical protein
MRLCVSRSRVNGARSRVNGAALKAVPLGCGSAALRLCVKIRVIRAIRG